MSEIIPRLWIGNAENAKAWSHELICVLEGPGDPRVKASWWIPILKMDEDGARADRQMLTSAARLIHLLLRRGRKVMVHCAVGVERSPLTVAYYLVWSGTAPNMAAAYKMIRAKRPGVYDRSGWL